MARLNAATTVAKTAERDRVIDALRAGSTIYIIKLISATALDHRVYQMLRLVAEGFLFRPLHGVGSPG